MQSTGCSRVRMCMQSTENPRARMRMRMQSAGCWRAAVILLHRAEHAACTALTLNMGRSGSFAKTSATNSSNGRSNSFRVGRSTGHHAGSAIAPPASHARSPLPVPRRCSAEAEQLGRVRPSRREARTPGGRWSAGRGVPADASLWG
eukprot:353794-Chlamydomonas_euryale.AAC.1